MKRKASTVSYLVWLLVVIFFFYEIFLRVFPSVMFDELMQSFRVSAAQLGTLSAFYFYSYAPMHIPVGLLMDRFGARKLLFFASFICAVGCILFAASYQLFGAKFGRLLMGLGSSFGFVGMVYVSSHWFPKNRLGFLVGLGNSIGMLGAISGEGPLAYLLIRFNWRSIIYILGLFGFILALTFILFLRKDQGDLKKKEVKKASQNLLQKLKIVCSNYQTWMNALIALFFYMTTAAFGSLWGIPFLIKGYGISKHLAGFLISMIFVGWIVGGPLIGFISDHFKRRKPFLFGGIILVLFSLLPVIYIPHLPLSLLFVLLFFVGFFSSAELLNFSLCIDFNPLYVKGTSIAITNCIIATGSSIMQPFFGLLLDWRWTGQLKDGIPLYTIENYRQAMLSFPLTLFFSFILLFFLNEKKSAKSHITEVIGLD